MSNIKCGHCHGYHTTTRSVFFCSQGPHAQANRARLANTRTEAAPAPVLPLPKTWRLNTPRAMVENLKPGRYAVRPDDSQAYVFLRVSRPKTGRKKGALVITTQHSDWYRDALTIWASGTVTISRFDVDRSLLLACADPTTAARAYGVELGRCSSCGRELTDERSRYYSIGPECEKHWPEIITAVNEERGTYESSRAL